MIEIPAGSFRMGSADFYPEEAPVREVQVSSFAIDRGPVTVAQFTRFVEETGYLTLAERPPDPAAYPEADPSLLCEGSAVFHPTPGPVPLNDSSSLVGLCSRRELAPSLGTGQRELREGRSSGHPRRIRGCPGVRGVGRQETAKRGGVGVRGTGRTRWRGFRLGRRAATRGRADGKLLAG